MSMTMLSSPVARPSLAGTQLRTQRPAARTQRLARFVRASGEGGAKGQTNQQPMSENKQAVKDVENMAAPEGDRALEGEKAQLSGSAQGAKEYESSEDGKGAESTTPAGEKSSSGVANDKSESAKGTH